MIKKKIFLICSILVLTIMSSLFVGCNSNKDDTLTIEEKEPNKSTTIRKEKNSNREEAAKENNTTNNNSKPKDESYNNESKLDSSGTSSSNTAFLGGTEHSIKDFITDNRAYIQDANKRKLNGISIKPIDKGYMKLKYIDTESNIDVEVKLDFKQDKTKDYLKTFNLCGDLSFISNNFTIYQYSSATDKSLGFTLLIDDTGKKFIWGYEQMRCSGIYSLN